jgi:hypothetical protein
MMTIIRPSHSRRWCRKCAREVEVVPIWEAGPLIGMTQLVLQECAETQKWHVLEDVDGSIQVCLDSLLRLWVNTIVRSSNDEMPGRGSSH